jgi:hypothetical protein
MDTFGENIKKKLVAKQLQMMSKKTKNPFEN